MHVNSQRLPVEEPGPSLRLIAEARPATLTSLIGRFFHLLGKAVWRAFQHDAFAIEFLLNRIVWIEKFGGGFIPVVDGG